MSHPERSSRAPARPQAGRRERARRFLWAAIAVAVVGEGGHQLFDRYGTALGHHAFHIVTIGGASLLFAALVISDIRRNGRPHFSWRLRPVSTPTERTSGR
jgi:hypothetical protein